jgi:hypothetical protein
VSSSHKARRRKRHREHDQAPAPTPPASVAPEPRIWTPTLLVIVAVGVALRLYYLRQPMRYDESVTYLYFASKPWQTAISSYVYPNNHVFHTLAVKACVALLGNEPWVLRLPAFLAGVAMIPAAYVVGRRLFGSAAAYVGAGLVAASGALVFYSTNARGYTIVCLATLVLGDVLLRLRERPSVALWSAFVGVTALGMWAVPVMLFPAGGLSLWFVLSALRGDTSGGRGDLARFSIAVITTATVTLLLYSPILATDGLTSLTGNSFVRASPWGAFFRQLAGFPKPLLSTWTLGYPVIIALIVGACAVFGLVRERSASGLRVSMAGSMYVWCAALLLVTHKVPFFRVWLFLVAPIALLAGHGLTHFASLFAAGRARLTNGAAVAGAALAVGLSFLVLVSASVETSRDTGTLRDAGRIVRVLSSVLRPGDRVVAPIPSNAPLAYYFDRAGIGTSYLSNQPGDSSRVYLIVNTDEGFTLSTPLGERLLKRFSKAQLKARYPSAEVYELF